MSERVSGVTTGAIVIWNPGAGSAGHAGQLREFLDRSPGVQVVETPSRDDAIREIQRACQDGIDRVIAAGGDGTVNAAVTALARWQKDNGRAPELAVLPLGTGNDLARSLGMPLDPMDAVEVCLRGSARPMDVMELTPEDGQTRVAGNMITAGNTGKYLDVLTDELKQKWGALCYLRGAVDVLEDLEVFRITLEADDQPPVDVEALNLFVANGRTSGGGITVCSDAELDDGRLALLVIREGNGFDLATLTLDYLTSDVRESDLVLHRRCRSVRVSCPAPLPLSADGDALKSSQFTVTVRPGAIQAVRGDVEA
ncbi:MAG TPA: diacylglycerol kinase family protein [Caulifigura sp.]|nr:diacylglycerol kinase family protein [Caulifigura sp.]